MGTPNRSGGSQFLHELITVDFSKVDPYGAVKAATLIAPLIIIGLFAGHEPYLVVLAGAFVLVFDLMLPPGPKKLELVSCYLSQ